MGIKSCEACHISDKEETKYYIVLFSVGISGTDPFDMQYVNICTATQDKQATSTDSCALKVLRTEKSKITWA